MKKIILILLVITYEGFSQNPQWIHYTYQDILTTAIEENFIWFGTYNGIVKLSTLTFEETIYQSTNSDFTGHYISDIAVDSKGNKWFGHDTGLTNFNGINWSLYDYSNTGYNNLFPKCLSFDSDDNLWFIGGEVSISDGSTSSGVTKFDGSTWTHFNSSNSNLPDQEILSLAIDQNDSVWVGTYSAGLLKFNGSDWVTYNTANSGLPSNFVYSIAFDDSNNGWFSVEGGLVKYNGSDWITYNKSNSGLPDNNINFVYIDKQGRKWIGTQMGLVEFNDTNWILYNDSNSPLLDNFVKDIAIDEYGTKWITTYLGLTAYNEEGIVSVEENLDGILPERYTLSQNYPNPFNPATTIKYQLPKESFVSVKVYDAIGSEVADLVNEPQKPGYYELQFDASKLSNGVYFYRIIADNYTVVKKMLLLK